MARSLTLYGRLKAKQREGKYFAIPEAMSFKEIACEYMRAIDTQRRRKGDDSARMNRWITSFGDQDATTINPRQIGQVLTTLQGKGKQPAEE